MRKLPTLIAAAALALTAVPASADPPSTFTFSKVLEYTNPCTDEVHDYTYTVEAREHDHESIVGVGRSTIETADGYVGSGPDPIVANSKFFLGHSTYILTNEDTGSKVRTHYVVKVDLATGEVIMEQDEWSCVRDSA